jgi:hypothetical protein
LYKNYSAFLNIKSNMQWHHRHHKTQQKKQCSKTLIEREHVVDWLAAKAYIILTCLYSTVQAAFIWCLDTLPKLFAYSKAVKKF